MRCVFDRSTWARMIEEACAARDGTETGGALVLVISGDLIIVCAVTGPGPGAVRRYAWFERQAEASSPGGWCPDSGSFHDMTMRCGTAAA